MVYLYDTIIRPIFQTANIIIDLILHHLALALATMADTNSSTLPKSLKNFVVVCQNNEKGGNKAPVAAL